MATKRPITPQNVRKSKIIINPWYSIIGKRIIFTGNLI